MLNCFCVADCCCLLAACCWLLVNIQHHPLLPVVVVVIYCYIEAVATNCELNHQRLSFCFCSPVFLQLITGVITNLPAARSTANGWRYATERSAQGASNLAKRMC